MSGHSKWSQIKRQKGVADQKRGQAFTKLSSAITIAVKHGGGMSDPNQNFKLRLAVDIAHAANMPKENIERAILHGSGKQAADLIEVVYEGFAPGGVSVIVEAATDNNMRTSSEIKNIFHKAGASFGQPGSVAYQFKQMGQIILKINNQSFDDIFLTAIDLGAEDVEDVEDEVYIYTSPHDIARIRDAFIAQRMIPVSVEIIRKPLVTVKIEDSDKAKKITNFLEKLEDFEDVQKVYTNAEFANK